MLFDARYKNRKVLSWRGRHFIGPFPSLSQIALCLGQWGKRPYFQRHLGLYFKASVLTWASTWLQVRLPWEAQSPQAGSGVLPAKLLCKSEIEEVKAAVVLLCLFFFFSVLGVENSNPGLGTHECDSDAWQLTQEPSCAHMGSLETAMLEELCGWLPLRWRPDLGWCLCIMLHTIVLPKLAGFLL